MCIRDRVRGRAGVFQTTHHIVLEGTAQRHDDDHGHDADDDAQKRQQRAQLVGIQAGQRQP